jgi:hypothetical protein
LEKTTESYSGQSDITKPEVLSDSLWSIGKHLIGGRRVLGSEDAMIESLPIVVGDIVMRYANENDAAYTTAVQYSNRRREDLRARRDFYIQVFMIIVAAFMGAFIGMLLH